MPTYKPEWRKSIPDDWDDHVTTDDYWKQSDAHAQQVFSMAKGNFERLTELVEKMESLARTQPIFDELLAYLSSLELLQFLSDEQKTKVWEQLITLISRHRELSDADWSFPEEILIRIEHSANALTPQNPTHRYRHLFSKEYYYHSLRDDLKYQQNDVIRELFACGGLNRVLQFHQEVQASYSIGIILGEMDDGKIEQAILPNFLTQTNKDRELAGGFISAKRVKSEGAWGKAIDISTWNREQIGTFLDFIPLKRELIEEWLGDDQKEFWSRINHHINMDADSPDNEWVIEQLLHYGRADIALRHLYFRHIEKCALNVQQCILVLNACIDHKNFDHHSAVSLIEYLQSEITIPTRTTLWTQAKDART